MNRTTDLRNCGQKTILVKKPSVVISDEVQCNYQSIINMHPTIETYCDVYAKDLEERLDLNSTKLLPALAVSTLLNPMFGLMSKIVGSGLMTDETHYNMARSSVIHMMQGVLDDVLTVAIDSSSSDSNDDSSEDGDCLPSAENLNYNKANNEF
jgi:hypothetical protein